MKSKKVALFLFKLKFLKYRFISSLIKKKIKKKKIFDEFKEIITKKNF